MGLNQYITGAAPFDRMRGSRHEAHERSKNKHNTRESRYSNFQYRVDDLPSSAMTGRMGDWHYDWSPMVV